MSVTEKTHSPSEATVVRLVAGAWAEELCLCNSNINYYGFRLEFWFTDLDWHRRNSYVPFASCYRIIKES